MIPIGIGIGVGMRRGGSATRLPFLLTSTGNGTGVSTLTVTVSADTLISLGANAKFYSDAGGTADESSTWTATTGAARTRYIKCTTGTAGMWIEADTITSWGVWTSGVNAASLSGDISKLTVLTVLNIQGNNTISGSIAGLTSLTNINVSGSNTISGSIAGLTSLTNLVIRDFNTISGSIAGLTSLTTVYVSGNNTVSGSIAGLTSLTYFNIQGSNTVSGSINALTVLASLDIEGANTVLGDLSLISAVLTYCYITGDNQIVTYTSGGDWSSITDQSDINIQPGVGYGLDEAEVDLFIIEVEDTRAVDRHLHLTLTGSNAPRSAASDAAVAAIIADGGTVTTNS